MELPRILRVGLATVTMILIILPSRISTDKWASRISSALSLPARNAQVCLAKIHKYAESLYNMTLNHKP